MSGGAPAHAGERAVRHRLAPGTALRDLSDAAGFLEQMGLLLQTPHAWLPSLFGAAQGKPAKPGASGFGQWPAHAWSWAGELAEREDVLLGKVVLGKRTLIHARLWPVLDAAVRDQQPRDEDERGITSVLAGQAPLRTDTLRASVRLPGDAGGKRYDKALARLEARGLVLCRPVLVDEHRHVALAELWAARFPEPLSAERGPRGLLLAAVAAAGPVPEREVLRWFALPRPELELALDELEALGRLRRDGPLLEAVEPPVLV